MVTIDASEERLRASKKKQTFRGAFRRNCHELLAMGYARMDAASFQTAEETVITGELVLAMTESLESSDAPSWAAHFMVLDDPPVNAPRRTGKRRRRVDIEMIKTQRGKRPRIQFEAKRLESNRSVSKYLGPDGMGLFLKGDYAAGQPDAGMLGYVQTGKARDWAEEIQKKLRANREMFRVRNGGDFRQQKLASTLESTYRSEHERPTVGEPITIFHTFLRFN